MKKMLTFTAACVLSAQAVAVSEKAVLNHYADLAEVMYADSLMTAKTLQSEVNAFLASPTESNLSKTKSAWVAARHPYQQTEAYRFGNAIVDDWEGKVNAWPLDEGLIDYTAASYGSSSDENALYTANVVANKTLKVAIGWTRWLHQLLLHVGYYRIAAQ